MAQTPLQSGVFLSVMFLDASNA